MGDAFLKGERDEGRRLFVGENPECWEREMSVTEF